MKLFKKAVLGAALALAFSGAQATPITVGGVTWDPDSAYPDFGAASSTIRQFIDSTTGALSGWGIVNSINGTPISTFVGTGELTFQFGGFMPTGSITIPTAASQTLTYTGGWIKVYSDFSSNPLDRVANPLDYNTLTAANTGNGTLWLSLVGHADALGNTFVGNTTANGGQGLGQLDAIGGAAKSNFDTNTKDDNVNLIPTFTGADFIFQTGFIKSSKGPAGYLDMHGTGSFDGNSIPEPASLALVGLGLIGAGALRRRKAAK